ncbi:hypothetical protein OS493_020350 [Desmophyllum pertusum]|uniref:Uncharacterized protein n=1 Tax=Desmophyllum pertusum TaxID=174260 RepID=A0A9W9ZRN8_9CNID|nr:hypothetical protein OS493_020350 [Desmophyllum pertusum]
MTTFRNYVQKHLLLPDAVHGLTHSSTTTPLKNVRDTFHMIVLRSGYNPQKTTHHCNRAGMATNFIIQRSIERGGIFPKEDVATLSRLAGWSETSGVWAMYVKDVFERHLDTSALIYRSTQCWWPVLATASGTRYTSRHASCSLPSPKKVFPGVAATIKRYFKAHQGEVTSFKRNPLLPQDVEHMIDVCGVDTPQKLQTAFMLSVSFHSGCRGGTFTGPKRRPAAQELLEQFSRPPPAAGHMKLGALSFE